MEDTDGTPVVWENQSPRLYETVLPVRTDLADATGLFAFIAKSPTGELSGAGINLSATEQQVMGKIVWEDFNFTYTPDEKTISYVMTVPTVGQGTLNYGVRFTYPTDVEGIPTYLLADAVYGSVSTTQVEDQPGKIKITAQLPADFENHSGWRYLFHANRGILFQEMGGNIQVP